MSQYAGYDFYTGDYLHGRNPLIQPEDFEFYAEKAGAVIRQYTLDNIGEEAPDSVKRCCCELAEVLYTADHSRAAQGVTAEKVGDISLSYESAETLRRALPRRMKSIVYSWLADTGLLHRGGDLC